MKRLFTRKALVRSLQVFAGVAVVYFAIALALIFWPVPEPFVGTGVAAEDVPVESRIAEIEPTASAGIEHISFLARDGESIFARRYAANSSTSIILMHGIANDSSAFEYAAQTLSERTGAQVIALDFRGHGHSSGPRFDVDYIGQYEDDLEDIIRFVKSEQPSQRIIVAGHSMGGGVAMRYALKSDAPVPDAYLLFAPNFGEGPTQRTGDETEDASSFVHFDVRRMIGIIMLNSIAIHALDDLPILYFNMPAQRMDYSYRAVLSAQPIRPETSDIALQAVKSPLLVIVGADDEVFEVGRFESFISENSDGETVILPGLTHDGVVNDPTAYEVVLEWYKRLP